MPNTKLNKSMLRNHYQYSKMIYCILLLLGYFFGDILYTVTTYRAPNARRVDIELVGPYVTIEEDVSALELIALEAGQAYELSRDQAAGVDTASEEYEIPLQEVSYLPLVYDPDGDDAYYNYQKLTVTLAAQEGDIFIMSRSLTEQMVNEGLFVDLTPYIESGIIDPGDRDMSRVTYREFVEDGQEPTGNTCVYALQTDDMYGLYDEFLYLPEDCCMGITAYSQNPDTAAAVMQSLIDQFTMTKEELQAKVAEENAAAEEAKNK